MAKTILFFPFCDGVTDVATTNSYTTLYFQRQNANVTDNILKLKLELMKVVL